jgi:hypothetical protein
LNLGQLDASATPDEQRSALFRYTWAVGGVEVSEMSDFVRKHTWPNLEGAVMTTAEKLRAEGLAKGRVEGLVAGLAMGQVQLLLKLVRVRFPGTVPPEVERAIATGTPAQIEKWALRFVFAKSAEEVIEE